MSDNNVNLHIQAFDPKVVKRNPVIAARQGDPVKAKIDWLASNMLERRDAGRSHQIMPGVVRVLETGDVECVVGWHRCSAERKLNESLGEGMEPFEFFAVAVPSTDAQALEDAIDENEYRVAATIFDKSEAMQKMADLGRTQGQIAHKFGMAVSTVSEYLRVAKLPKKIKAAHASGTLTDEFVIGLARHNKDSQYQEEMFALSKQEFEARKAIFDRAEARAKGEPEPEAAAEEPAAEQPESGESESQPQTSKAPVSDAVKNKKKKSGTGKKALTKIGAEDLKAAERKSGRKPKKKSSTPAGRTKSDLQKFWNAIAGEDVKEDIPETWREFAVRQEMFLDNAITEVQFKNTIRKCLADEFNV